VSACYDRHEITRRQLLGRGVGAGLSLYAAKLLTVDGLIERAQAQAVPGAPVLVSVFLPGGCDLLGALPPLEQLGRYNDLRTSLAPGDAFNPLPNEPRLGFHPALADGVNGGVVGMFANGRIGLMPGIDYANPDLSHFHSRNFWERGMVTLQYGSGWLGRWVDVHGSALNPLQAVSLDERLSPILTSDRMPAAAVTDPEAAAVRFAGVGDRWAPKAEAAWTKISSLSRATPAAQTAMDVARATQAVGRLLAPVGDAALAAPVAYPDGEFAQRLRTLAALVSEPLGVRVATVTAPGEYDTHDNQARDLSDALGELSRGLSAFQADLEARGVADRVLTFVWSEFGRRPKSNRSAGTDHGAGGMAWVQGTRAVSGVLTDFPDLTRLDEHDNLAVTIDFRSVYASLLEQWLASDATQILPDAANAGRIQLVRS
jgi:uncharacterized protein (DUF1501 family)